MFRNFLTLVLIAMFAVSFVACQGEVGASVSAQINSEAAETWPSALKARESLEDRTLDVGDSGWLTTQTRGARSKQGPRNNLRWQPCNVLHSTQASVVERLLGGHVMVRLRKAHLKHGDGPCRPYVVLTHEEFIRQSEEFFASEEGKKLLLDEEADAALAANKK